MLRLALAAAFAILPACGGSSSDAPEGHTLSENGIMHRPELRNPMTQCVACHGSNLQGGQGPSCTSCHDKKW